MKNYRPVPSLALTALLLPLSILACDSASPTAPGGSILILSTSTSRISLTGETTIFVEGRRPNLAPLAETEVRFGTSLGVISPIIVALDSNGRATATLRGDGVAGTATVTVSAGAGGGPAPPPPAGGGGGMGGGGGGNTGGTGGTISATISIQIGESDATKPVVIISANPPTIAVLAEALISLLGRNSDGTPVGAGQRIRLTAELGDLRCENAPTGGCSQVFTDANGEAEATFVAGTRGGTGRVGAILGTSDEAQATIDIRDALASLFLVASRQTIERVDGGTNISLTAILQDAQGEPVQGTSVVFEPGRGTLDRNVVLSNSQGEAVATLTVRAADVSDIPQNGTFTVRASATSEGNTRDATLTITVLGAP